MGIFASPTGVGFFWLGQVWLWLFWFWLMRVSLKWLRCGSWSVSEVWLLYLEKSTAVKAAFMTLILAFSGLRLGLCFGDCYWYFHSCLDLFLWEFGQSKGMTLPNPLPFWCSLTSCMNNKVLTASSVTSESLLCFVNILLPDTGSCFMSKERFMWTEKTWLSWLGKPDQSEC